MSGRKHHILILLLSLVASQLCGQQTTVIQHYAGDTTGLGAAGFVPTKTTEHRVIINYYEPATSVQLDQFQQLTSSYLNMYIDRCAVIKEGDVKLKKNKKETLKELNNVVFGILEFYDYQQLKNFKGFSPMVAAKLEAIDKIDFRKTGFASGAKDEEDRQRMQQYYLQKELSDLKLLVSMEVGIYGDKNLLIRSNSDETVIDQSTRDKLLAEYKQYDPNKPLQPIKVQLSEESIALINFKDTSTLDLPGKSAATTTSGNDDLTAQLLQLMQANNDKLDGMQRQIDDLRTEQMRLWQSQQEERNLAMQRQLDDLRSMVIALVQMSSGDALASTAGGTTLPEKFGAPVVSNVPKSMNIYFAKGSTLLDANSKLSLNEVVDILARDPNIKLILTGFADRSGNAAQNLLISQQRANTVKTFLTQSGLGPDRFITKYFGDRDSQTTSATDRKVVVEFVR